MTAPAMGADAAYAAIEAFLEKHRLCRPGLDEPHVTDVVVAL